MTQPRPAQYPLHSSAASGVRTALPADNLRVAPAQAEGMLYYCPACWMPVVMQKHDRKDERLWLLNPDGTIGYGLKPESKEPTIITCPNCQWSSVIHEPATNGQAIYKAIRDAWGYNSNWRGLPAGAIVFPRPANLPAAALLRPWPKDERANTAKAGGLRMRCDTSLGVSLPVRYKLDNAAVAW